MKERQQSAHPPPGKKIPRSGLRVVAIGGGTGLSTVLKGLKAYCPPTGERSQTSAPSENLDSTPSAKNLIGELCAVVTVTDDGGSSGRLRKELNMLPPGDIRNCIVALSEDEALLSRLFQHRFERGSGLEGHSFGNLFLAALTSITGDFSEAVRLSSEILATRGHIYPSTTSNVELEALLEDGSRVRGETKITASKGKIRELFLIPPDVEPLPQTLEAIARADLITLGPGSLFTSLVPNLLVKGIAQAIVRFRRGQGFRLQSDDAGQRKPGAHRRRPHSRPQRPCTGRAPVRLRAYQPALRSRPTSKPNMRWKAPRRSLPIWRPSKSWACAPSWEIIWKKMAWPAMPLPALPATFYPWP